MNGRDDPEFGFYVEPRACTCGRVYSERGAYWRCRLSHEREAKAADEHAPAGDEHSASRRANVLERDAPHLIAPIEPCGD